MKERNITSSLKPSHRRSHAPPRYCGSVNFLDLGRAIKSPQRHEHRASQPARDGQCHGQFGLSSCKTHTQKQETRGTLCKDALLILPEGRRRHSSEDVRTLQVRCFSFLVRPRRLITKLCRAVHYCGRDCQVADFQSRHRDECATFAHLPTTVAFLSTPDPTENFPHHPILAHANQAHVGCWVTIDGCVDCRYVNASRTVTQS